MSKKHGRENDSVVVEPNTTKSEVALREEEIQAWWSANDIFNKSLKRPAGAAPKGDYVFYDGPPFATGTPHYGHILAGTIKDAIPRFFTMNGYRVRRKWGWDCHGLPLENLIEKKLGLSNKRDIEEYGIKNFNEQARGAVLEYADEWRRVIPRLGRFVDMDDDYKTMDSSYTESVWWVFKQLHEKGLVFEGYKAMHLCPRCGTTLSNFEVNLGYKDIKDIAVTVKLPLLDEAGKSTDTSLLVWTTTPWTLPGNLAAAVNKDFTYAKVKVATETGAEYLILAKGRLAQLGEVAYEIVEDINGSDLVGRSFEPPFAYLKAEVKEGQDNAWKIWHADYVELGEQGTGAVHIAPAYGEDDMQLAKVNNIPIVHHVDYEGRFKPFVTDLAGQLVKPRDDDAAGIDHKDADIEILKALQATGKIFKKENITHSYPHCWRDDTPLLNYATTSWFVNVPKIKDDLVAANQTVKWVPEHVGQNRFGKWLEGARDWAISRQRYWGAPLPIWRNPKTGDYKVFGSLSELNEYVPKSGNTYFMMRHGESESNVAGVVQTLYDQPNPLTPHGRQQVSLALTQLRTLGITKIITSPFRRTLETAKLIQTGLGLADTALILDERLKEIQIPELEGQANTAYHQLLNTSSHWCEGKTAAGESWSAVRNRMGEFLYECEQTYQAENILVVSHNAPLRMAAAVAEGHQLKSGTFNHDADGFRFNNAEVRQLDFSYLPHNDNYELDFHRPYIDDFKLVDTDGTALVRVPEVFDCWFESGAMPYAQHHYLGENEADFLATKYPAQFIAESIDQTRGWFYSLIVLGVALFGKSPYENVITNGLVLAEDGKKMSKSLRNYPDPMELVGRVGADAMRYYLLSSPIIRGEDLNFSEKEVAEQQRKNVGRLHNVLAMYELFADQTKASADSKNVLDQWIVARLNQLIMESTKGYQNYELDKATRPIADFIDDLSVWYLRRSRERLKSDDGADKALALGTLRFVLRELAKVMAPIMPFYAEYLYRATRENDEVESVHLATWPTGGEVDTTLLLKMVTVRTIVSAALEARTKAGVKVRQPLATLSVAKEEAVPPDLVSIIADEVNVKQVVFTESLDRKEENWVVLDVTLTPELIAEGAVREVMRAVQDMRKTAGLQPADTIILTIATAVLGQAALTVHYDLLTKTVGAVSVVYTHEGGQVVKVGDFTFGLAIALVGQ